MNHFDCDTTADPCRRRLRCHGCIMISELQSVVESENGIVYIKAVAFCCYELNEFTVM
jgi:hypothetical protein